MSILISKKIILVVYLLNKITSQCEEDYKEISLENTGEKFSAGDAVKRNTKEKGTFFYELTVSDIEINSITYEMKEYEIYGDNRDTADEFRKEYFKGNLERVLNEIKIRKEVTKLNGDYFPVFYGCGRKLNASDGKTTIYVILQKLDDFGLMSEKAREFTGVGGGMRLKLYYEVAQALNILHKKQYVYGDLCPRTIMSNSGFDKVKLPDFESISYKNTVIFQGTPLYRSPEKAETQDPKSDFSFDIWAFGISVADIELGGVLPENNLYHEKNQSCFFWGIYRGLC